MIILFLLTHSLKKMKKRKIKMDVIKKLMEIEKKYKDEKIDFFKLGLDIGYDFTKEDMSNPIKCVKMSELVRKCKDFSEITKIEEKKIMDFIEREGLGTFLERFLNELERRIEAIKNDQNKINDRRKGKVRKNNAQS